MYAPLSDADADDIMARFIAKNNERTNGNFHFDPPITSMPLCETTRLPRRARRLRGSMPPRMLGYDVRKGIDAQFSTSQSVVPVPSADFIYEFAVARPNVTYFGVAFSRVDNNYQYQIWYNNSLTANKTQSVSEPYGVVLTSLMRGLDEAIRTHYRPPGRGGICRGNNNGSRPGPRVGKCLLAVSHMTGSDQTLEVDLKDWPSIPAAGTVPVLDHDVAVDRCSS